MIKSRGYFRSGDICTPLSYHSENRLKVENSQDKNKNNKPTKFLKEWRVKRMKLLFLGDDFAFFHKGRSCAYSPTCSFTTRSNINPNAHLRNDSFPSVAAPLPSLCAGGCLPAPSPGAKEKKEARHLAQNPFPCPEPILGGLLWPWCTYLPVEEPVVRKMELFPLSFSLLMCFFLGGSKKH